MARTTDGSLAVQVMSGLLSDADTANLVLKHVSARLFQQIIDSGVDSLFDSEALENQLQVLQQCLQFVLRHRDNPVAESGDGCTKSIEQTAIICLNLLDTLCLPLLGEIAATSSSYNCSDSMVASTLSVVIPCFSFATHEARTQVTNVLIDLLNRKESSWCHLSVVKALCQLCERHNGAGDESPGSDLLTAIETLCVTADEPCVGLILVQLVPSILSSCYHNEVVLTRLWSVVERCYINADDDCVARCCFLICGLTDVFFLPATASVSTSVNLLHSSLLWNCVQKGWLHSNALTRKRAVFILRRALDFAGMIKTGTELIAVGRSSDLLNSVDCLVRLSSMWHEVIVLFEILEEKQVGIFKETLHSKVALDFF